MSSQQALIDAATRHQIYVLRYAGGVEKEMARELDRITRTVIARIESGNLTVWGKARQDALLLELKATTAALYASLSDEMIQKSLDFGIYEADFSMRTINPLVAGAMAAPSPVTIQAALFGTAMTANPSLHMTIGQALEKFGGSIGRNISREISDGVVLGDTTEQIVRRVQSAGMTNKRHARALTRTMITHISSVARDSVLRENASIFDGYEWVSTLDSRTTFICASRDGKIYPIGSTNAPKPPAHWGCRSTIIPKVKRKFDLAAKAKGQRPSVGASGPKPVGAKVTYSGWLKRQPASFQDEVLGKARGRLFRTGKLPIDKFTDASGKVYSLDRLRSLEAGAFAKANL